MNGKVIVIGGGLAGLAAATALAPRGFDVHWALHGYFHKEVDAAGCVRASGGGSWLKRTFLTAGEGEFLALGSGAIESAIRRVINLRLKGNGICWEKENAEAMLVVRAHVLSNRWEEVFAQVCQSMGSNRRLDWAWQPPDMLEELKAGLPIKPPQLQVQTTKATYAAAA